MTLEAVDKCQVDKTERAVRKVQARSGRVLTKTVIMGTERR